MTKVPQPPWVSSAGRFLKWWDYTASGLETATPRPEGGGGSSELTAHTPPHPKKSDMKKPKRFSLSDGGEYRKCDWCSMAASEENGGGGIVE